MTVQRGRWLELADGVHARRYERLDQTLGLVIGDERCLVIDTGCDEVQGEEFARAIRALTPLPWTVVLTHAHFDHHFGTAAFLPCPVWAHESCTPALRASAEPDRAEWAARFRAQGDPASAEALAKARLTLPTHHLTTEHTVDLGNRPVHLIHPGPAHTDHDVLIHVPDAAVTFAGDLIEEGAPLQAGPDAHVRSWPAALDVLLSASPEIVVPGHGNPVDQAHVLAQRATLT